MIYIRLALYAAAAAVLLGAGWYLGGLSPKASLAALKAQGWQDKYQASQAALLATQKQLADSTATAANNARTAQDLQDENAKIAAGWASDRELAQRLLNASRVLPAPSPLLPQTGGGPPAPAPSGTSVDGRIGDLLANAAAECKRNAARLDAVSAQIIPQL